MVGHRGGEYDRENARDQDAWNLVVAAFGGDAEQAEAEVTERWHALQRINPSATREDAIRRLAWEYKPRPIEHVFPGDNWAFMVKAAQSKAHILLLDLEDAVATTRKDVARKVIVLLIRTFRGHSLAKDELEFLKANALPQGKAEQLEQQFMPVGDRFQMKAENRFPEDQMILVRPNNLRTKWAAGDYWNVIREIGDLIAGIYMPKVEGPHDVRVTVQILRAIQRERDWVEGMHKIFVLTELPSAILAVEEILAVGPEVEEGNLGIVDYTAATGGRSVVQQEQFTYMRFPLLRIVEAAHRTGKVAGTGITVRLNADDTEADTVLAIALGIHRKWSVHPAHIDGIARHTLEFPPVVRKRLTYPEVTPYDLERLQRLAREEKPILPPIVFVPRPVTLCRSMVTVDGEKPGDVRSALASSVDMIIVNAGGLLGTHRRDALRRFVEVCGGADRAGKVIALQLDLGATPSRQEMLELFRPLRGMVQAAILPSVEQPEAIRRADGFLTTVEQETGLPGGSLALGARITKPETVEQASFAIATASRRVMWLVLDLPGRLPKEDPSDPKTKGFYCYHSALVAATAAADIDAIAGRSGASEIEAETVFAANLGFHGKLVTVEQAARVNEVMNPPRASERPAESKGSAWDAFKARWINSVERALEILELYATADQERNLGAVAYNDPVTNQPELVDAATARIYYRQLERALKAKHLTDAEQQRYLIARGRLLLALRPGGMEQVGTAVFPGQRVSGYAITVDDWMVRAFAKISGDRNRYHLDKAYAERSRFRGLVAHGLLTVSHVLASLGRELPAYALESLEMDFKAPAYFGDTITPAADVQEVPDGGGAQIRLTAVNHDGKIVCEGRATLRPQTPTDAVRATPEEIVWLKAWARDVTASIPATVYDFTDPQSPRQQTFSKTVSQELVRATCALFGELGSQQLSPLLAIGTMAMTSAESSPGHLLLSAKVVESGAPIRAGDVLTTTATAPPHDQIRRSQKGKGQPIVPIDIAVTNSRGEVVLRGQVVKLMEEQVEN
jgi:citrate lyase beta subunit/acyl dehydratase